MTAGLPTFGPDAAVIVERWGGAQGDERTTAFQSPWWVDAYARAFDKPPVVLRSGDASEDGLAFMEFTRVRGSNVLRAFPPDVCDYTDLLLGDDLDAVDRMVQVLLDAGADVIELPEAPAGGHWTDLAQRWPGPVLSTPSGVCVQYLGETLEAYLATLPGRRRRGFEKYRRRHRDAGVAWRECPDPASGVAQMMEFHLDSWRGRGLNPVHDQPEFHQFLTLVAQSPAATLIEFTVGSEVSGYTLFTHSVEFVGNFMVGHSGTLPSNLSQQVMEMCAAFELVRPGQRGVDFLRGAHDEKARYATELRHNRKVLLVQPGSARGAMAAAEVISRSMAKHHDLKGRLERLRKRQWSNSSGQRAGSAQGGSGLD